LFTNARQVLQILFVGEKGKEMSPNALRMFSLLSNKLISLLFDGTLKQKTHFIAPNETFHLRTLHIFE
jgi:hypothetical protein